MSDGLQRYEGQYLVSWVWHEGNSIARFLKVTHNGDRLAVQSETITCPMGTEVLSIDDPVIERRASEARPLSAASDHTFDAIGFPRRYRFVLGGSAAADSVIVIRDGEPSEPCPRFVELPDEIPGRRERGEWFDLGNPTICMTLKKGEAVFAFYQRLGFVLNPTRPNNVISGWTVIGFLDFQRQPCINYRGPSIVETAFELARRGYPMANGLIEATHVQGNEAGSVSVRDPDGHHLFFNTHAAERPVYDAWLRGDLPHERSRLAFNVGGTEEQNTRDFPVTLPLGDLVACLDVRDLGASASFYQGMGFEVLDRTPSSALVFTRPARENKFAFPVRLREAEERRFSFGFLCDDVGSVAREIEHRGIELISLSDGPAFVDPDGNRVSLLAGMTR